mgnify:CR=1 FL=1
MQLKKLITEVALIVAISVFLGIVNQSVNPNHVIVSNERPVADVVDSALLTDSTEILQEPVIVDKAQLVRLMQEEDALLIDARIAEEFEHEHIPGAINVPMDMLGEFADLIDSLEKDRWIICYCGGPPCDNGKILAADLFFSGFERVGYYDAGMEDWLRSEEAAK